MLERWTRAAHRLVGDGGIVIRVASRGEAEEQMVARVGDRALGDVYFVGHGSSTLGGLFFFSGTDPTPNDPSNREDFGASSRRQVVSLESDGAFFRTIGRLMRGGGDHTVAFLSCFTGTHHTYVTQTANEVAGTMESGQVRVGAYRGYVSVADDGASLRLEGDGVGPSVPLPGIPGFQVESRRGSSQAAVGALEGLDEP